MTFPFGTEGAGPSGRGAGLRAFGEGGREGGYALLVALLVLVGLTALATGGVVLSTTNNRMSDAYRATAKGFYLADAGLREFLGTQSGVPDPTATYSFPEGTATVTASELVAAGDGRRLFRVSSVGTPDPPFERARRTVGAVVVLDPVVLVPPAGLVAAGTWKKEGSSGTVSGEDGSTSADCPEGGEDRAGVYAYDYVFDGGTDPTAGDPPWVETMPDNPYDFLAAQTPPWTVDWPGILAGDVIEFDYVVDEFDLVDANKRVPTDFPSLAPDEWAVIFIDGPGAPPAVDDTVQLEASCCSGQGIIVTEQSLEMKGSISWDGLLMAGGVLNSEGNNDVEGGALLGLNTTLAGGPADTDLETSVGSGTKTYQFDTCNLLEASREAGKLAELPGTWFESF